MQRGVIDKSFPGGRKNFPRGRSQAPPLIGEEKQSDKNETVEKESDHLPKSLGLESRPGRQSGRVPAEVNSRRDGREHPGDMGMLGEEVSGKGSEQRDGDLDRRIVQLALHPACAKAHDQAEDDPADANEDKLPARRA